MPFELDGDDVETSIRLEGIDLPTLNWSDLEGQEFAFPANPDQGYIDGSVYMDSAHHPVDVTSIRFDHATDTQPQVTISGVLNLEYEGLRDYANAVFALTAPLVLR